MQEQDAEHAVPDQVAAETAAVGGVPFSRFGEPTERVRRPASADQQEEIHRRALLAAAVASNLKAEDIRVLDMRSLVSYTDYLVICTGRSTRQTRRISEEIGLLLKRDLRLLPLGVQGDAAGDWILMDYLDFIVHIFTPETRDFYRLDVMWKEAPAETVDAAGVVAAEVRASAALEESAASDDEPAALDERLNPPVKQTE